jgi:hypothetical protein
VDIDVHTGGRRLMVTIVVFTRVIVVLVIIPVLNTAGNGHSADDKEQKCPNYVPYIIFHNKIFILILCRKTLPVPKKPKIALLMGVATKKCRVFSPGTDHGREKPRQSRETGHPAQRLIQFFFAVPSTRATFIRNQEMVSSCFKPPAPAAGLMAPTNCQFIDAINNL